MLKKIKKRWGINSNIQAFLIIIVFSITGLVAVIIAKPIMELIGLSKEDTNPWIYRPLRIVLIFPIYQISILIIGTLFGQFNFFWNFQKKILKKIGLHK